MHCHSITFLWPCHIDIDLFSWLYMYLGIRCRKLFFFPVCFIYRHKKQYSVENFNLVGILGSRL